MLGDLIERQAVVKAKNILKGAVLVAMAEIVFAFLRGLVGGKS